MWHWHWSYPRTFIRYCNQQTFQVLVQIKSRTGRIYKISRFCALIICSVYSFRTYIILFIGLFDYEKAFNFVNRFRLINKLVRAGADRNFFNDILNMYKETFYIPKIEQNCLGYEIQKNYGVTQVKNSLCDIFSSYTPNMLQAFKNDDVNDFAVNLLQLADDTVTQALSLHSFTNNLQPFFLYLSESQISIPLQEDKDILIEPDDPVDGYNWIWFHLSYADKVAI